MDYKDNCSVIAALQGIATFWFRYIDSKPPVIRPFFLDPDLCVELMIEHFYFLPSPFFC